LREVVRLALGRTSSEEFWKQNENRLHLADLKNALKAAYKAGHDDGFKEGFKVSTF